MTSNQESEKYWEMREQMAKKTKLDVSAAHKYFSAECFNKAWKFIDKPTRSAKDEEEMLSLSLTSLWHWSQREDHTPTNMSVGYWQVSRVYALMGQADNARRYGQLCLETSQGKGILPFYLGYAYEALARAASVVGDQELRGHYLEEAQRIAETLPDKEAKKQLLDDLGTIR